MPDYAKEPSKNPKEDKPKVEKVVTGEVVSKSKGPGRKFKEIFFGGDAKHAASFVANDVLLPALRNLIVDMVAKGAERLIYGENRRPGNGMFNYGGRYPGGSSYSYNADPRGRSNPLLSPSQPSRRGNNRHEMNDLIIGTREEADMVLERLTDILDMYQVATLADLYDLVGLSRTPIDNVWGWVNLSGARVVQMRQGYLLDLPPLVEIPMR